MLRKLLKALKTALRSMMKMLSGAWAGVFGGGGGEDIVIDDDNEPAETPAENSVENEPDPMDNYTERLVLQRQTAAIITYACDADVDGKRPTPSPCLSRIQKSWLAGLGAGDLRLIADSDREVVCRHIGSGPHIQGLFQVRELPPVVLQPLTKRDCNAKTPACKTDSTPTFFLH